MFDITRTSLAYMAAGIRAIQDATKYSQDKVQKIIVEYREQYPDISDAELGKLVIKSLENYYQDSASINQNLTSQQDNVIGFPIKNNKTHLQLKMAKEWGESQGEELISQIENGKFYHNLTNLIANNELPILQSASEQEYWGNENPSVSSVLLASIAATLGEKQDSMPGAATFFPLLNSNYELELPNNLLSSSYPFASKGGMMLFGDYQFGGHRYFEEQLLFGPEDCSSAVGKATYLTTKQVRGINTTTMRAAYEASQEAGNKPDPKYNYKAITRLSGDIREEQLRLIQPGDIFLQKKHTGLIATSPDNKSNISTMQYSREIDEGIENKKLGGGVYVYNLCEQAKIEDIYVFRSDSELSRESSSLDQFLSLIDLKASYFCSQGNISGDCRIFFEDNEAAVLGDIVEDGGI